MASSCAPPTVARGSSERPGAHGGGEIVHELELSDDGDLPAAGDLVQVDVEWARRYALMRTHTALPRPVRRRLA